MTCDNCSSSGDYSVRVTGGSFTGAHESEYACSNCTYASIARILRSFPHVEVHPLRKLKKAIEDLKPQ